MKICDGCGRKDFITKPYKVKIVMVSVYGYDLCEDCNGRVIDFVRELAIKNKEIK